MDTGFHPVREGKCIFWAQIARTYFTTLANQGYRNAYIYSYLNLMNTKLNSQWLRSKTAWIAQYNTRLDYGFADYNGARAWQYTSASTVPGISGNVDMNVFDNQLFRDVTFRTPHNTDIVWMKQYNIADGYPDGTYGGMRTVVRQDMAAFIKRLNNRL